MHIHVYYQMVTRSPAWWSMMNIHLRTSSIGGLPQFSVGKHRYKFRNDCRVGYSFHWFLVLSILSFIAVAACSNFVFDWFKQSRPTNSKRAMTSLSVSYLACSNSALAFFRNTSDHRSPFSFLQKKALDALKISRYNLIASGFPILIPNDWSLVLLWVTEPSSDSRTQLGFHFLSFLPTSNSLPPYLPIHLPTYLPTYLPT